MAEAGPDYVALFHSLAVPYAIVDRDFRYVALNDMVVEAVGRPRDQMLGQSLFELFPEIEERQAMIEDAFRAAFDGKSVSMTEVPYSIPIPGRPGEMREIWWTFHCHPIPEDSGEVRHIGFHAENITQHVKARDLKDAIAAELQHRVSNIISLTQVIARQTASQHTEVGEFLEVFDDRVHAMARTHALLTGTNWDGLTFEMLVREQLQDHRDRIDLKGPTLLLSATEAQALSMAIHELTTNALKYGALSGTEGRIKITWALLDDDGYHVTWSEEDLENVSPPDRKGFGTAILTRILPGQIGGSTEQDFTHNRHTFRITVPKRRS